MVVEDVGRTGGCWNALRVQALSAFVVSAGSSVDGFEHASPAGPAMAGADGGIGALVMRAAARACVQVRLREALLMRFRCRRRAGQAKNCNRCGGEAPLSARLCVRDSSQR